MQGVNHAHWELRPMFPVCQAILHQSGEDVVSTCVLVDDLGCPCWAFRAPAFAKKRGGGGGLSAHPFRYPAAFKDLAPPKWVKFSIKLSLGWVTEVGLLRQVWEGILWSSSSWATPAAGRQGVLLRNVETVPDQDPFPWMQFLYLCIR